MANTLEQLKRETKDDARLYGCIKELYEQGVPFEELKALIPDIKRTREQLHMKRMLENNNEVLLSMITKEMAFLLDAKERQEEEEFKKLGCTVLVTTVDGSYGIKGFVTDALKDVPYTYFYTCGPEPMLKAIYKASTTSGQMSFEERMGCGFGACMGCSCKTLTGYKRICKDGPVMRKEEIAWEN
jgi:NAD(P)H-flavin reductase